MKLRKKVFITPVYALKDAKNGLCDNPVVTEYQIQENDANIQMQIIQGEGRNFNYEEKL